MATNDVTHVDWLTLSRRQIITRSFTNQHSEHTFMCHLIVWFVKIWLEMTTKYSVLQDGGGPQACQVSESHPFAH